MALDRIEPSVDVADLYRCVDVEFLRVEMRPEIDDCIIGVA